MEKKDALRFYIQTRGLNAIAIHEELITAHGPDVVSYTVHRWCKKTNDGIMEIEDNPRSGRPVTGPTEENIQEVRRLIEQDPHYTYDDIEEETALSRGITLTIISKYLELKKITSRWVPHELTIEQKQQRVNICKENLKRFREGLGRLCDIVTGDEKWIYLRQVG